MSDFISWDEYFMGVAFLSAKRSKDPHTKVGACLVNADKRIVGVGYNGLPWGCKDSDYPWKREGTELDTKYPYVIHAEVNAILNSFGSSGYESLHGLTLYVSLFPCNECAKVIIQSGIKHIVYMSDKYAGTNSNIAAKRMLLDSGVELRKYVPEDEKLTLDFMAE